MMRKFWQLYRLEFSNFYRKHKTIIWLTLGYIVLKIPSLFEPYWYGDEGVTLTVGMAIRKGYLLYRDIYDNKTPLLYLVSALVNGKLFYFKLIALIWGGVGLIFFYRLSSFLLPPKNRRALIICNLAFVALITLPTLEGNIVNGEIVFLVFSIIGYYLALVKKRYLTAGIMFSLAFLTKVPALFDFLALAIWIMAIGKRGENTASSFDLLRLLTAFSIPIGISIVFFFIRGGGYEYIQVVFIQMVGYLSSWGSNSPSSDLLCLFKSGLVIKTLFLVAISIVFWHKWCKAKTPLQEQLAAYWLMCAIFGATLSGRPYPHYLLQAVAPLSLCLGYLFTDIRNTRLTLLLPISFVVLAFGYYNFWHYPCIGYGENFGALVLKGAGYKTGYYQYFDGALPDLYRIADAVKVYTNSSDKILVWSDYAQLYPMTARLPATRYVTAYHYREKNDDSNYLAGKQANIKAMVVDKQTEINQELSQLLPGYVMVEEYGRFQLYIKT